MATDHRRFHAVLVVTGHHAGSTVPAPPARVEFWSDGERYLSAVSHGGRTVYDTFTPPSEYIGGWSYWTYAVMPSGQPWRDIYPLFRAVELRNDGRITRNGTRYYRLTSVGLRDPELFATREAVESPRDVRLEAVIDGRGLVRTYRLAYVATVGGATVRVNRTIRYTTVGATTVTRPTWIYDSAGCSPPSTPDSEM